MGALGAPLNLNRSSGLPHLQLPCTGRNGPANPRLPMPARVLWRARPLSIVTSSSPILASCPTSGQTSAISSAPTPSPFRLFISFDQLLFWAPDSPTEPRRTGPTPLLEAGSDRLCNGCALTRRQHRSAVIAEALLRFFCACCCTVTCVVVTCVALCPWAAASWLLELPSVLSRLSKDTLTHRHDPLRKPLSHSCKTTNATDRQQHRKRDPNILPPFLPLPLLLLPRAPSDFLP